MDGIWWAIVTASTVGYGDIAPTTLLGRSIAIVLMLTGIGLISTLAASITAYFLGQENAEMAALKAQLDRIESQLSEVQREQVRARTRSFDSSISKPRRAHNEGRS